MSLVRPFIECASSTWDPHIEQLIAEVEKIQCRAAHFVLSKYKIYERGSMSVMLKKLGWTLLKLRRQMDIAFLFSKGLNNRAALSFLESLQKPTRGSRHIVNTMSHSQLVPMCVNTVSYHKQ